MPDGARLAVLEWLFDAGALAGRNGRFKAKNGLNGLKKLKLTVKNGRLSLALVAKTDLAALKAAKTADWTLGVEVGADVAGVTRAFKPNKKGTLVKGP